MVYTDRERLTVIELTEEKDALTFDELAVVLLERPANMIYVEVAGLLYGIVSMGDIARANNEGKKYVVINKQFTRMNSGEYMRARQIFKDRENINALPVVDEKGRLLGDYVRWDDIRFLERSAELFDNERYDEILKKEYRHIVFVKPCEIFENKMRYYNIVKVVLEKKFETVEAVDRCQLSKYYDKEGVTVVYVDEDEQHGTWALYQDILDKRIGTNFTLRQLFKILTDKNDDKLMLEKGIRVWMQFLRNKGVHFVQMMCKENESDYCKKFSYMLEKKFEKHTVPKSGRMLSIFKKKFFGDIYNEQYEKQIFPLPHKVSVLGTTYKLADNDLPMFHSKDGERLTINQPDKYERCIYMYGPCIVIGSYAEDKHTIASWLQEYLNSDDLACKVVNYGVIANGNMLPHWNKIMTTPLREGDIVLWYNNVSEEEMFESNVNLMDVLEANNVPVSWVVEIPEHCNYKVNQLYAKALYDKLLPVLCENVQSRKLIDKEIDLAWSAYLNRYFAGHDMFAYGTVGSIVMNCNPFTLGHRYLIEYAKEMVDYLIVFVVEEDKSLFTFEERFAMVRDGVDDLENIMVVPSGEVILSQRTFPEYFVKVIDEDIVRNVEQDVTIFAEKIAPKLNITYRFVGEEPEDAVTNEYNNAMKKILPSYGIMLVEVPRLEKDGHVISASLVRRCLERGEDEQLELLIPESTRRILFTEMI